MLTHCPGSNMMSQGGHDIDIDNDITWRKCFVYFLNDLKYFGTDFVLD